MLHILAAAFLLATVPAAETPQPQALKSGVVGQLDPASVAILRKIQRHVGDSVDFRAPVSKQQHRELLAQYLFTYLRNHEFSDTAIQKVIATRCVVTFSPEYQAALAKLRAAGKQQGIVAVELPVDLVELQLLIDRLDPAWDELLAAWKTAPPQDLDSAVGRVGEFIDRQGQYEIDLGLTCDLLEHPQLAELMKLDLATLRQAVSTLQPVGDFQTVRTEAELRQALAELAARKPAVDAKWRAVVADAAKNIRTWLKIHQADLEQAVVNFERLVNENFANIPKLPSDDLAGFFRVHFAPAARSKLTADAREMPARLTYCIPLVGGVGNTNVPGGATAQIVNELDLGIDTVVRLEADGTIKTATPAGIRTYVKVDSRRLAAALAKLGFPPFLHFDNLDARLKDDLSSIDIEYVVSIPGYAQRFFGKFTVTPSRLVDKDFLKVVDSVQTSFLEALAVDGLRVGDQAVLKVAIPDGVATAVATSRWADGRFGLLAEVQMPELGRWQIPLEFAKNADQWELRCGPFAVPADAIEKMRSVVVAQIKSSLVAAFQDAKFQNLAGSIDSLMSLDEVRYDPDKKAFMAKVLVPEVVKGVPAFSMNLSWNIGSKAPHLDPTAIEKQLRALVVQHTDALREQIQERVGELKDKLLADHLPDCKLNIFGAELEIGKDVEYSAARRGFKVSGKLSIADKQFEIKKLWIVGFDADKLVKERRLDKIELAFDEVEINPGIETLVSSNLKIDQSLLKVAQFRRTAQAVHFQVLINLPGFGEFVAGDISLGAGGVEVKPFQGLKEGLIKKLVAELKVRKLPLADLGPVTLELDEERSKVDPLEIWVKGNLEIASGLNMPFRCQVAPKLGKPEFDKAAIESKLGDVLSKLLPSDKIQVSNLKIIDEKPYGIRCDVKVNVFEFGFDLPGVEITTSKIRLPAVVSLRFPATIPIPTAFALVNPGVEVNFEQKSFAVTGSFTVGSGGVDKIFKVAARLEAALKDQRFTVNGTLILADFLPLAQVTGVADFRAKRISLDAQTTGLLDKLLQVRAQTLIDGQTLTASQSASLGVLGFRIMDTESVIDCKVPQVRFSGSSRLLIAEAQLFVEASPNLERFIAAASLNFEIGGFNIAGADLKVDIRRVELLLKLLGFKIKIIAPSLTTMTPDRVLRAILSVFDFDIDAFFKAIIKREITINLVDGGKSGDGALGEGDPGGGEEQGEPGGGENEGQPDKPPRGNPNPTPPVNPGPRPPTTKEKEPRNEVFTYEKGKAAWFFEPAPKDPGFYKLITQVGDSRNEYFHVIPKAVVDHLTQPNVTVISELYASMPDSKTTHCLNGHDHNDVSLSLTVDAENKLRVVGLYREGECTEIAANVDDVGDRPGKKSLAELVRERNKDALLAGDRAVLRELAHAAFAKRKDNKSLLRRVELPAQSILPAAEAYLIESVANDGSPVIRLQTRKGPSKDLPRTCVIAELALKGKGEQADAICSIWNLVALESVPVTTLWVGNDQSLLLWLHASAKRGESQLVFVGSQGGTKVAKARLTSSVAVRSADYIRSQSQVFGDKEVWPKNETFGSELSQRVRDGFGEVLFIESRGTRRAVVGRGLDEKEAEMVVLQFDTKQTSIGPVKLDMIDDRFRRWRELGAIDPKVKHADLRSGDARRWLLDELGDSRGWTESFRANPLGLFKN